MKHQIRRKKIKLIQNGVTIERWLWRATSPAHFYPMSDSFLTWDAAMAHVNDQILTEYTNRLLRENPR